MEVYWEHSGSVVDCVTQEWAAADSSLNGVTELCPWARHIYPCLVLVQPRKTRPDITDKIVDWDVKIQIKIKKEYTINPDQIVSEVKIII